MGLRLYLDTADRAAAEPLLATGVFAGLTTNPAILQRAGLSVADIPGVYSWATAADAAEIFFQAWGADAEAMTDCGLRLRELGEDVVVKVPASRVGMTAGARLVRAGVPVLVTAIYAPVQVVASAAIGAAYVAPYVAKIEEEGRGGIATVTAMQEALAATGCATEILSASLRDVETIAALARAGVRCFTMAPPVAEALFADPLTAAAVAAFDAVIGGRS